MLEAGSAPESGVVAMALARRCALAEVVRGGASGPAEGARDEGHEQSGFARVGEGRALKIEAAGLGIAEQTFDRPTLSVGLNGGARCNVGQDDQPALRRFSRRPRTC